MAITGSLPTKAENPAVPITASEQIESTPEAFEAGAGIAHCHVRDDEGRPTSDPKRFARLKKGLERLVTGALGKMGLDLIQLGQSEIGEVTAGTDGGSSTMPQKANPVATEALVTLARLNAGDVAGMQHAPIHAQERDGTALGLA